MSIYNIYILVDELIGLNDPSSNDAKYPVCQNFYTMVETNAQSIRNKLKQWSSMNLETKKYINDITAKIGGTDLELWTEVKSNKSIVTIVKTQESELKNKNVTAPVNEDIDIMEYILPIADVPGLFWDHYNNTLVRSPEFVEN